VPGAPGGVPGGIALVRGTAARGATGVVPGATVAPGAPGVVAPGALGDGAPGAAGAPGVTVTPEAGAPGTV
jgi:hypothetical protein